MPPFLHGLESHASPVAGKKNYSYYKTFQKLCSRSKYGRLLITKNRKESHSKSTESLLTIYFTAHLCVSQLTHSRLLCRMRSTNSCSLEKDNKMMKNNEIFFLLSFSWNHSGYILGKEFTQEFTSPGSFQHNAECGFNWGYWLITRFISKEQWLWLHHYVLRLRHS